MTKNPQHNEALSKNILSELSGNTQNPDDLFIGVDGYFFMILFHDFVSCIHVFLASF